MTQKQEAINELCELLSVPTTGPARKVFLKLTYAELVWLQGVIQAQLDEASEVYMPAIHRSAVRGS